MALQSTLHQCSPNKKKNPWNIIRKSKGPRIRYLSTNDAGGSVRFYIGVRMLFPPLLIKHRCPKRHYSLGYADRHSGHSGHPIIRSSDNSGHFDHFSPSSHPVIPVIPGVPDIPVIPAIPVILVISVVSDIPVTPVIPIISTNSSHSRYNHLHHVDERTCKDVGYFCFLKKKQEVFH